MKFKVMYLKPKKKGFSEQTAVLLSIEDAVFWQDTIKKQGCQNVENLSGVLRLITIEPVTTLPTYSTRML